MTPQLDLSPRTGCSRTTSSTFCFRAWRSERFRHVYFQIDMHDNLRYQIFTATAMGAESAPTRRATAGPGLATSTGLALVPMTAISHSTNLRGARLGVSITHRERATMIENQWQKRLAIQLASQSAGRTCTQLPPSPTPSASPLMGALIRVGAEFARRCKIRAPSL
jgi:hypothetical protein